jgi:condensin complex subunit 1
MRMAIIEIIGILIKHIAMDATPVEGGDRANVKKEKQLNVLFELLFERFLDLSGYVRAKVINTLSKLCEYVFKSNLLKFHLC